MTLLKAVPPGEATGGMEKIYRSFLDSVGAVPPPLLMASTSPAIQALQAQISDYYRDRSGLRPLFLTLLRYLTAVALEMEPCIKYNAGVLVRLGIKEEEVARIREDPGAAPLEEKEGWLLAFVIKALRAPETFSQSHVGKLRQLGWTDTEIFDALYASCMLVGMERMMRVLDAK